jgi:serine/threonine protein kinase
MNLFASLLSWLCDGYWPTAEENEELVVRIQDVRHRYTPLSLLTSGDAADVYLATTGDEANTATEPLYLLKVARVPESNAQLDIERKALSRLLRVAATTTYWNYLPPLVESFATRGRSPQRINVFRWEPGFYTLEQVHTQFPALDDRHLAWIFKRLLTVLGFIHRQNLLHGAVLPCHALIHAAGHGLQLIGWGGSVAVGQRIRNVPARYQEWYPPEVQNQRPASPATDLFLAARCLIYLAGGDPVTNRMPDAVPLPMQRFLKTCLLDSVAMRPDDAWALMEEFDDLLYALYGPPKFHELTLT